MLDPERVKLSAANIGFLKQKGIDVDFDTIRKALQTDDGGCAKVRREADTPVNELHVMGGQRLGLEGNMNINEYARQARQMNGYPLRSFSASQPAVILPPKYGGFPQYVNNESERDSYVSRFTEPLSAPLQQNTMLLGPQGFSVASNSASNPFEPLKFEMNLHKSRDAIDYNDMMLRQKKNLLQASMAGRANKENNAAPMVAENNGIFIGANGQIMSQVESATSAVYMQKTAFDKQQERTRSYQRFQPPASDNGRYLNLNNTGRFYRTSEQAIQTDVLEDNASTIMPRSIYTANQEIVQSDAFTPMITPRQINGSQSGSLLYDLLQTVPPVPNTPINLGALDYTPTIVFPNRDARRQAMSAYQGVNRNQQELGYQVRDARSRRKKSRAVFTAKKSARKAALSPYTPLAERTMTPQNLIRSFTNEK